MRMGITRLRLRRKPRAVLHRALLFFGFIGLLTASGAQAQDAATCAKLLEPDVQAFASDTHLRLAYLHTLDRQSYEEAKKKGGATAGIPVDGVPLKGTLDWEDYSKRLKRESEITRFTYDFAQSTWYYARSLPNERAQLFLQCVTGVHLQVKLTDKADNAQALWMKWNERVPNEPPAVFDFRKSRNVVSVPSRTDATFQDREEKTFVFTPKDPARDMLIVINGGGKPPTLVVPPPLPPILKPEAMACRVILNMIRDDHYGTSGNYDMDISLDDGKTWVVRNDRIDSRIPHGVPWGGSFNNWTDYEFGATIPTRGDPPRIWIRLHALWDSHDKDWIRINRATINCPGGPHVSTLLPIHDPDSYGPGQTRTLQVDDKGDHGDGKISFNHWDE